jgi:hypothetical protein
MNNQPPVSIVVKRPADHLKRHSQIFVQDGPGSLAMDERAICQWKIERCGDEMATSRTYDQFETELAKAQRLGAYPYNGDVSLVAHADLFAD